MPRGVFVRMDDADRAARDAKIREMVAGGMATSTIARQYNIDPARVRQIVKEPGHSLPRAIQAEVGRVEASNEASHKARLLVALMEMADDRGKVRVEGNQIVRTLSRMMGMDAHNMQKLFFALRSEGRIQFDVRQQGQVQRITDVRIVSVRVPNQNERSESVVTVVAVGRPSPVGRDMTDPRNLPAVAPGGPITKTQMPVVAMPTPTQAVRAVQAILAPLNGTTRPAPSTPLLDAIAAKSAKAEGLAKALDEAGETDMAVELLNRHSISPEISEALALLRWKNGR